MTPSEGKDSDRSDSRKTLFSRFDLLGRFFWIYFFFLFLFFFFSFVVVANFIDMMKSN